MQPAVSLDAYCREPVGHYFVGPNVLHWWAAPDLLGFTLWGRPGEEDVRVLVACFEAEIAAPQRRDSFIDASRMEGADVNAFNRLLSWVVAHREALGARMRRQAMVRPPGFAGAVAAGFFQVHEPPYPVQIFEDTRGAFAWLENGTIALARELDALYEQAAGSPVVAALRAALATRLADAEIGAVAKQLGLSERTLQRRLSEAGTSFIAEHNAARLKAAQRLLADTHMKIEAVADAVGCASPQHLALLFRKHLGVTPSAWREAHAKVREG